MKCFIGGCVARSGEDNNKRSKTPIDSEATEVFWVPYFRLVNFKVYFETSNQLQLGLLKSYWETQNDSKTS